MIRTIALGAALGLTAAAAGATTVTTNTFENAIIEDFSGGPSEFTAGPRNFNMGLVGVTYTSTNSNSVYKYQGGYGLSGNGSWGTGRDGYVGTNGDSPTITFTFDQAVGAVGGFVNYATGWSVSPTLRVYDINDNLLETFNIGANAPILTPGATDAGAFRGILRDIADIRKLTISGSFIVLDDLTIGDAALEPVPLPAGLPLLLGALGVLGIVRRRQA